MTADVWLIGKRGQALAGGITCLAMALAWFGVADPIWSWFNDRSALLEQRQTLLHRMRDTAATLPVLRAASVKNPEHGKTPATIMLRGATDAVAAADLQERVEKMATTAGVSLTAVETLSVTSVAHWHKVPLRISLNAPWPAVMKLLQSIEQSPTRILIDDVHFHSTVVVTRPTVLPVQASMVLYGFRTAEPGVGS